MKQFLNAAEIAKLMEVDRATITRWIKKGLLKAERIPGTKSWRIPLLEYQKFLNNKNESR